MQGQEDLGPRCTSSGGTELPLCQGGNTGYVLGLRQADDCALPPDARTPGLLPGVLPVTENTGHSLTGSAASVGRAIP